MVSNTYLLIFTFIFQIYSGHCSKAAPELAAAAKYFENVNRGLIAKVDRDSETALNDRYEVSSYPTFLWFEDGKKVEPYPGTRTKNAFL